MTLGRLVDVDLELFRSEHFEDLSANAATVEAIRKDKPLLTPGTGPA